MFIAHKHNYALQHMKRKSNSSDCSTSGYVTKKPRSALKVRAIEMYDESYVATDNEAFDKSTINFADPATRVYAGTCEDCGYRECRIVKCKTPACTTPKQECWLEHGYCMWCHIYINANGYSVVNKINNPLFCQLCFKSLLGLGTSLQNNADFPDFRGRKYHQLCWQQLN